MSSKSLYIIIVKTKTISNKKISQGLYVIYHKYIKIIVPAGESTLGRIRQKDNKEP